MTTRARKVIKAIVYFHLLLLVALVLTHCTFSHYAKKSYRQAAIKKPYDVIIVPGVPYLKDKTSSVMKMRLFWAKHLYDSGFTKNIIFSGSAVYSPFVESIAMKGMADSLGIPTHLTFSETKAEHSTENIYYSWKMARAMGFEKIALATDPFQSRMLKGFAKKYCPGVSYIPIVFDKLNLNELALPNIDTSAAYIPDFVSITERETFRERFRGTRGHRVRDEVKAELEAESTKESKE